MIPDNVKQMLTFAEEKQCEAQGFTRIAGIDEVGRGCIAGPVVASAVIFPYKKTAPWFEKVNDSKFLSPAQREAVFPYIQEAAAGIGTGIVSVGTIDKRGIAKATKMAMIMAIEQIAPLPDYILIDYFTIPGLQLPQKGVAGGDSLCFSIACASIVAKVTRDRLMVELDEKYSGYGLARHKGYCTREHLDNLHKLGPCAIHRRSFKPVSDVINPKLLK